MINNSSYSKEYLGIRHKAETEWPQWKLDYYNNQFAISTHALKIIHKEMDNTNEHLEEL